MSGILGPALVIIVINSLDGLVKAEHACNLHTWYQVPTEILKDVIRIQNIPDELQKWCDAKIIKLNINCMAVPWRRENKCTDIKQRRTGRVSVRSL